MKATLPPTLSEYLLRESEKFPLYPFPLRRGPGRLLLQKTVDETTRQIEEWRKTFAPKPTAPSKQASGDSLDDQTPAGGGLLDQFYCRERLRAVPEMVERTRKLSQLVLSEIDDQQSFVYLREAANCYILGLPQAAIAVARAAVEARLRTALSKHFGKEAVDDAGLHKLTNDFAARLRFFSLKGKELANKVRMAGDVVLHKKPADPASALDIIEAARAVILELRGR